MLQQEMVKEYVIAHIEARNMCAYILYMIGQYKDDRESQIG